MCKTCSDGNAGSCTACDKGSLIAGACVICEDEAPVRTRVVLPAADQALVFAQLVTMAIFWTVESVKLAPMNSALFVLELELELAHAQHVKQVLT